VTAAGSPITRLIGEAQQLGFVGSWSVDRALEHARGFAVGVEIPPRSFVDLGSGGGLPGLVLAELWPTTRAFLVDANARRCAFLRNAAAELDVADRVVVVQDRAEVVGRSPEHRHQHPLVVARGFGAPAVTAECAAPLLGVGGRLVVSEPPADEVSGDRWPESGLAQLGMRQDRDYVAPFHYQVVLQDEPCPDRYPRRVGVPAKRPLF
jgi:16S rRNA (guanine527-N7)-methyltransferase